MSTCPLCQHEHSRIIRTTYGADVRRVRSCGQCGHKWVTVEVPLETVKRARALKEAAKSMAEAEL